MYEGILMPGQVFGPEMQSLVKDMRKTLNPKEITFEILAREYAPFIIALKSEVGIELTRYFMSEFTEYLNRVAQPGCPEDDKIRLAIIKGYLVHILRKVTTYEDDMNKLMGKK
jgi:hypothetical protein